MCDNCTARIAHAIEALEDLANGQEPVMPAGITVEELDIQQTADGRVQMTMSMPAFMALTLVLSGQRGTIGLMGLNPDDDA